MFEAPDVADLDTTTCSEALIATVAHQRRVEATRLAMVAHWVDLHAPVDSGGRWRSEPPQLPPSTGTPSPDTSDPGRDTTSPDRGTGSNAGARRTGSRGRPRRLGVQVGGDGTPRVAELALTELGVLLETTTTSAERYARDALDLRHRLPELWTAAMTGTLEVWKARKAATVTRPLTFDQARTIAPKITEALKTLPYSRALAIIEAQVIAADPAAHHARLHDQAAQRYLSTARTDTLAGLRTLILKGTREEVARILGMVDQLAKALHLLGDPDALQLRKVKALVLMANPALACLTLARAYPTPDHPHHETPHPAPDPEPEDQPDQTSDPEPDPASEPEPDPEPEPEEPEEVSPLRMAVLFGRLLNQQGAKTLDRLRPRTVLYLHLAEETLHTTINGATTGTSTSNGTGAGVARVHDLGPATLAELKSWLGHDHLTVRPVLDPANIIPVDSYEIPTPMREALQLREPFEIFPFGTQPSHHADHDHTIPYTPMDQGGPPGQTHLGNLGPLSRGHHRAKTFGDFTCHQPLPGLYLWRIPSGHWYRVDHTGTHHLGRRTPDIIRHTQQPAGKATHLLLHHLLAALT